MPVPWVIFRDGMLAEVVLGKLIELLIAWAQSSFYWSVHYIRLICTLDDFASERWAYMPLINYMSHFLDNWRPPLRWLMTTMYNEIFVRPPQLNKSVFYSPNLHKTTNNWWNNFCQICQIRSTNLQLIWSLAPYDQLEMSFWNDI